MKGLALALFLLFPSLALAQPGNHGPPSFVLVWYDRDTLTVVETVIPDNDHEGGSVYTEGGHPVMGSLRPCKRVQLKLSDIDAVGFANALANAVPGIMLTAPQQQSVAMLGEQVDTMLAEAKVKRALFG